MKKGQILLMPSTNREWLDSLSDDEKAEFLMRVHANDCIEYPFLTQLVGARNDMERRKSFWKKWLAAAHKE